MRYCLTAVIICLGTMYLVDPDRWHPYRIPPLSQEEQNELCIRELRRLGKHADANKVEGRLMLATTRPWLIYPGDEADCKQRWLENRREHMDSIRSF